MSESISSFPAAATGAAIMVAQPVPDHAAAARADSSLAAIMDDGGVIVAPGINGGAAPPAAAPAAAVHAVHAAVATTFIVAPAPAADINGTMIQGKCCRRGCPKLPPDTRKCAAIKCKKFMCFPCHQEHVVKFIPAPLPLDDNGMSQYAHSKQCHKLAAKEIEGYSSRNKPWDTDTPTGEYANSSEADLMDWMRVHGNYSNWRGNFGGVTKVGRQQQIADMINNKGLAMGIRRGRTALQVGGKIASLEDKYRKTKQWIENTGQGVLANEGEEAFEQRVRDQFKHFYDLDAIMSERACMGSTVQTDHYNTARGNRGTTTPPPQAAVVNTGAITPPPQAAVVNTGNALLLTPTAAPLLLDNQEMLNTIQGQQEDTTHGQQEDAANNLETPAPAVPNLPAGSNMVARASEQRNRPRTQHEMIENLARTLNGNNEKDREDRKQQLEADREEKTKDREEKKKDREDRRQQLEIEREDKKKEQLEARQQAQKQLEEVIRHNRMVEEIEAKRARLMEETETKKARITVVNTIATTNTLFMNSLMDYQKLKEIKTDQEIANMMPSCIKCFNFPLMSVEERKKYADFYNAWAETQGLADRIDPDFFN